MQRERRLPSYREDISAEMSVPTFLCTGNVIEGLCKEMSEERKKLLKQLLHLSSIGISMVLAIVFGLVIGVYLDRWLGTEPWLTIVFLLFGVVAAFRNMFHIIRKYGFPEEEADNQADNVTDDSHPRS